MAFRIIEHTIKSVFGHKRPVETKSIDFCDRSRADRRVSWLRREYGFENIVFEPQKGNPALAVVYVRVD